MAKRKQARPSRPGGSTSGHVEQEGEGELAAILDDAEEIHEGEQDARGHSRKKRTPKKSSGTTFFTLGFS